MEATASFFQPIHLKDGRYLGCPQVAELGSIAALDSNVCITGGKQCQPCGGVESSSSLTLQSSFIENTMETMEVTYP